MVNGWPCHGRSLPDRRAAGGGVAAFYLSLMRTGMLLTAVPGAFLISNTPLSPTLLAGADDPPVPRCQPELHVLASPGGTFATPKANRIRLGALTRVSTPSRASLHER